MMTKSQIVAHLADKNGLQKRQAAALLEELAALAEKETKSTGQFVVPGFGKAVKAQRKARKGRNPQTGAEIKNSPIYLLRLRLRRDVPVRQ